MVHRMTSKERIKQLADEAVARAEAKAEKGKKAATKKASTVIKRDKVVWKVFDANYREVACFPYSQKDEAFVKCDELKQKKSSVNYFVNEVKVSMEDT